MAITATHLQVSPKVNAQLIPDKTLGTENSVVTPQGGRDFIEGGARRGSNLFHSFLEFNVGNKQQVYFANPDGIANILTRVTGSPGSQILTNGGNVAIASGTFAPTSQINTVNAALITSNARGNGGNITLFSLDELLSQSSLWNPNVKILQQEQGEISVYQPDS